MAAAQNLMAIEKGFWTEGADYYRAHVDAECLLAFTEMAGVQSNEAIAEMTPDDGRWRDVEIEEKGAIDLSDESSVVTYEVRAKRPTGEPYHALISTGYVKRDGEWKMAFHQQTPLQ